MLFRSAKSQHPRPSASPRQTVDVLPPVPCPRWFCSSTPPLRLKFCYMSTSSSATGAPQVLLHATASTLECLLLRGLAKYHDDRVPLLPLRVSRTSTSSTPHRNAEFLAVTPNIYGNLCDYERERLPSTPSYSDSSSTSPKTNMCHYFHYRRRRPV